jgi:isopenicillin N synthase-like dioxygenase
VLVRGGRHADFGIITILQQDSVGGLRLQKWGETEWFPVPPTPNSFVVNVGDMLQRWTDDRLLATSHQVVFFNDQDNNDDERVIPERFSDAFFCNANKEVVLDPAVFSEKPKYEPMKAIDYITGRLADTIAM